jgi:hypothetical protein
MLQITGLCGNYNGDLDDDSRTPAGVINKNVTQFVDQWKTNSKCDSPTVTSYHGACARSHSYEEYAKGVCAALKKGRPLLKRHKTVGMHCKSVYECC